MKLARSLSFTLSLLAGCSLLSAHEDVVHPPKPYPEKEAHAPRPLPDRIILTWSGDPATTQAVTWRTDTSVKSALAELTLATSGPIKADPRKLPAQTRAFDSDLGSAHYHSVEFTDLQPDTMYAYRVGDGANWSEWFQFRTASREAKPFSFVYFGDAQNDVKTHWSRVFREAVRTAPRAAFTLHAGDLINRANRDAEWGEWHGAPAWVNGTIPAVVTPGNHEYANLGAGPETERIWTRKDGSTVPVTIAEIRPILAAGTKTGESWTVKSAGLESVISVDAAVQITAADEAFTTLTGYTLAEVSGKQPANLLKDRMAQPGVRSISLHWRPQFTLPENGPDGLKESVYYLDYQGTRIISLNSNEQQDKQVAWLRSVLANNPQRWTVVTFHHPIVSPANGRDNPRLRELWQPVLDEFKVDLVLTGHDHTYARSGDLSDRVGTANVPTGLKTYDPAVGTVYVVSVSGPKMYNITNENFVRTAEDTQLFQVITVNGDEIHYEARTAIGQLYDAFVLKKRGAGQPNELRETLPPQNRRAKAAVATN